MPSFLSTPKDSSPCGQKLRGPRLFGCKSPSLPSTLEDLPSSSGQKRKDHFGWSKISALPSTHEESPSSSGQKRKDPYLFGWKWNKRPRWPDARSNELLSLPRDIALKILSELEASEAVRLSVLGKGLGSLWRELRVLNFDSRISGFQDPKRYIQFVSNFIEGRDHSVDIDSFYLHIENYNGDMWMIIGEWIKYAVVLKAQTIVVDLTSKKKFNLNKSGFEFPLYPLDWSNSHVSILTLRSCRMSWPVSNDLSLLLNKLILERCILNETTVAYLMKCPTLKELHIIRCRGVTWMKLESMSLRRLVLKHYLNPRVLVDIIAPSLDVLVIQQYVPAKNGFKIQAPYLKEAKVWFSSVTRSNAAISRVICSYIPHVVDLHIQTWWFLVIRPERLFMIRIPLLNIRFLELESHFSSHEVPGINAFLRFCPNVEALHICHNKIRMKVGIPFIRYQRRSYILTSLRSIDIKADVDIRSQLTFLHSLIPRCPNLKKIRFYFDHDLPSTCSDEWTNVIKQRMKFESKFSADRSTGSLTWYSKKKLGLLIQQ